MFLIPSSPHTLCPTSGCGRQVFLHYWISCLEAPSYIHHKPLLRGFFSSNIFNSVGPPLITPLSPMIKWTQFSFYLIVALWWHLNTLQIKRCANIWLLVSSTFPEGKDSLYSSGSLALPSTLSLGRCCQMTISTSLVGNFIRGKSVWQIALATKEALFCVS